MGHINQKSVRIAIGPISDTPSWTWVGFDTGRELSKYFTISYFERDQHPEADIVVMVKKPPSEKFIDQCRAKNKKIVYLPVDYFNSLDELRRHSASFKKLDMILVHCDRMIDLLKPYCKKIFYIDHHNKYGLSEMNKYKKDGFVLYVGACQYVPYLIRWLRENPVKFPVKILTDLECDRARFAANQLSGRLKMGLKICAKDRKIQGYEVFQWSESLQYEMLKEAKAGLDIKFNNDFNQYYKPSTKIQKLCASGIPCAVNSGSYSFEYLKNKGLNVVEPSNQTVWFSEQYWQEVCRVGEVIKKETSLEAVGLKYKSFLEKLL